jgi:hypothetical protein
MESAQAFLFRSDEQHFGPFSLQKKVCAPLGGPMRAAQKKSMLFNFQGGNFGR